MMHTLHADFGLNYSYDDDDLQKPSFRDDIVQIHVESNDGHHQNDASVYNASELNHASYKENALNDDKSQSLTHHYLDPYNPHNYHYNVLPIRAYDVNHRHHVHAHHDHSYEHDHMQDHNDENHVQHNADGHHDDVQLPSNDDLQGCDNQHKYIQYLDENHGADEEFALALDPADIGNEFVEVDPDNRYGRYLDLLGRGAIKTVYRGFDKQEGIEVAWNQLSLHNVSQVQNEIYLLGMLKHKNIIRMYKFWVDQKGSKINFITELCSNTLLGFRQQHRHVCMKAIKDWARQILRALAYLHRQSPPIIHRDLKCENIFVNCSDGKIKIGDFGSATLLEGSEHLHNLVGTPEFMAPEMYMEEYNELVDVYAFGMCMIEILTVEIPYKECKNVAQIYQKVKAGVAPKALDKIKDVEMISFIKKCFSPVLLRPSAAELLLDPFLLCEGYALSGIGINMHMPRSPILTKSASSPNLEYARMVPFVSESKQKNLTSHSSFIKERSRQEVTVFGKIESESKLMMWLRIVQSGEFAPIHVEFPYDCNCDTPEIVAEEMVQELDFAKSDSAVLADLIASALTSLMQGKLGNEDARLEGTTGSTKSALTSQVSRCLEVVA